MTELAPIAIVPARLGSVRLRDKPLVDIGGAPLIQRVCENLEAAGLFGRIVIATEAERVAEVARRGGFEAVLTPADLPSGTDRVAAAARQLRLTGRQVVVNVQGDEPFVEPASLSALLSAIAPGERHVVTPIEALDPLELLHDPDVVKAVVGERGRALYFSRQAVPFVRAEGGASSPGLFNRHVGVYAYTCETLQRLTDHPPHPLERAERLEQLRWLAHAEEIRCVRIEPSARGIDTEEDRRRADAYYRTRHRPDDR